MNALFINAYGEQACGVWQFGMNLYAILKDSENISWRYGEAILPKLKEGTVVLRPPSEITVRPPASRDGIGAYPVVPLADMKDRVDWVLYNWSSLMGGWLNEAPFPWFKKQAVIYHDGEVAEQYDAIFFSSPLATMSGKWHIIGRPIPCVNPLSRFSGENRSTPSQLTIGCHGFRGAWADEVVKRVMQEFEGARIRLQLPASEYCDPEGTYARAMADRCRAMVAGSSTQLMINHNFLTQPQLLDWLYENHLNCYIRPLNSWRGISSAPDAALAVNKPLAVNCSSAFRHLHQLKPSIVIDESSLTEILGNGLSPLINFKQRYCNPEIIRNQVESVMLAPNLSARPSEHLQIQPGDPI
jgi:hypothetical protein